MDTIIYIIGPTGVGKTGLATELAKKLNGNLLSADSIQVYKGLDIISGKDLDIGSKFNSLYLIESLSIGTHMIGTIPTWCLDLVDPSYSFHVSDFYKAANFSLNIIRKEKKLPVVVGGSTLYVNALLNPIDTISIKSDQKLREELDKKSIEYVRHYLKKISPDLFKSLNESELGNKRRIIRKIEIAKCSYEVEGSQKITQSPIVIGLYASREYLKKNIDTRVDGRINSGAFEEAEKLFHDFDKLSPQIKNANGYKQIFNFLKNEYSKEEAIQRWKFSEYRHAKNQMTYFKKYIDAEWFDVEEKKYNEKVMNFILNNYKPSK